MGILSGLLNLVYPAVCGICGKKLCGCANGIKKNPPPYCKKCGRSIRGAAESVETCWECADRTFSFERSWSSVIYEGAAKEALHLLKYSKKFSLSGLFSNIVIQFLKDNPEILTGIDAVAAVPLYSVKLREREFNQAHLLAEAVRREFKLKDISYCLKRTIATRPQSGLDRRQRVDNVRGTFKTAGPLPAQAKNLLLVDDLFTTGATLNECARVLKKAGAGRIRCLTFARGA